MADMVNQPSTQLLAPSPPRGGSNALRAQNGGAPAREPFANSLDRSMAHPQKNKDAPTSEGNTATSPTPARTTQGNARSDAASPATNGIESGAPNDAAPDESTDESDPISETRQPNDVAASLAATPAALAAASANPATPVPRSINPLATTLSVEVDPKARSSTGKTVADLGAAVSDTRWAADQKFTDTVDTTPNRLRAAPFVAQLDARLDAGGDGAAELMAPVIGGTPATALGFGTIHVAGTDRAQTLHAALPMHVSTPASQPGWADAVGNRVLWLVGRDESRAELLLTPPSLGKLEISLTVSGDTTTAQFVAATPAAREALEQAMPRLREMFEQAGVTLAESNVNTAPHDQSGERGSGDGHGSGQSVADDARSEFTRPAGGPWLQRGEGMIDTFA